MHESTFAAFSTHWLIYAQVLGARSPTQPAEKLAAEASSLKLATASTRGWHRALIDEAATFKCQERVKGRLEWVRLWSRRK